MDQVSAHRSYGGTQGVYTQQSSATGTPMTFSVFVPDHAPRAKLPVLCYLSGLTCTHAKVTEKGEFRAACAQHGIIFLTPDASPRGDDVRDDEGYDLGKGAGFYVDALDCVNMVNDYVQGNKLVEAGIAIDPAVRAVGHITGLHLMVIKHTTAGQAPANSDWVQ